jgi:hypothetical protein
MATFSTTALNQALDGITVDRVSLHSGSPGGYVQWTRTQD